MERMGFPQVVHPLSHSVKSKDRQDFAHVELPTTFRPWWRKICEKWKRTDLDFEQSLSRSHVLAGPSLRLRRWTQSLLSRGAKPLHFSFLIMYTVRWLRSRNHEKLRKKKRTFITYCSGCGTFPMANWSEFRGCGNDPIQELLPAVADFGSWFLVVQ